MKTWFITGASSGFGKALAEYLLQKGDRVAGTARQINDLKSLHQSFPNHFLPLCLDITQRSQISNAWNQAVSHFNKIDILVNNAGYGLLGALEETDDDRMEKNVETNFTGPLRLIREAIPHFRKNGQGHLISITAIAAFCNELGFSVYGASKAALEASCQSLVGELAPFGIRVSVVVPGPFRTDFISRSLDIIPRTEEYKKTVGSFETLLQRINGKQSGDPLKAAQAIDQLANSEKPPFRLVLGKYANDKMEKRIKLIQQELESWKDVGYPTDYT